ncbi:MAG: type II toxin-antitoxin system PemK/MazF family toxin [Spirochaetaceae bacterium]|jgi:mRNA interferase MazF|nr:type II toxin-antitoxin system PemK/MazF family toxin [Spirochaetaceae bacterium]
MKRGELYRVHFGNPSDTKRNRVFVIVSRQSVIDSKFQSVICAPIYTNRNGDSSQVLVGIDEGLKHDSAIVCDELVSLNKHKLTNYVGSLSRAKLKELKRALRIALDVE